MKQVTLFSRVAITLFLSLIFAGAALAQSAQSQNQIKFISFSGLYHLSRDNHGVSLLTTQEIIGADFQNSG